MRRQYKYVKCLCSNETVDLVLVLFCALALLAGL
jgi:hypothetical protein